jgi:hypothetical protein
MGKMNKTEMLNVKYLSVKDRVIEFLKPFILDVERISEKGPKNKTDDLLVSICCKFVLGEIGSHYSEFADLIEEIK